MPVKHRRLCDDYGEPIKIIKMDTDDTNDLDESFRYYTCCYSDKYQLSNDLDIQRHSSSVSKQSVSQSVDQLRNY